MRNTKRGSWFIQELNKALRLHARDKHLADILVQVTIKHLILASFSVNVPFMESEAVQVPPAEIYISFLFRSTVVLRRGRVMPLELLITAAKKCPNSPARCAKISSFSPSTSPSIELNICTHRHTHNIPFSRDCQWNTRVPTV